MNNNKILLIFESVPESVKVYYLFDLSDYEAEMLLKCHGKLIGSTDDDDCLEWLDTFMMDVDEPVLHSDDKTGTPLDLNSLEGLNQAYLVITGMML